MKTQHFTKSLQKKIKKFINKKFITTSPTRSPKSRDLLKDQQGQMTMELVLLIAIGIAVFTAVRQGVGNINPLGRAFGNDTTSTTSPWIRIQGLAQYGVWIGRGQDITVARRQHPNSSYRYLSAETQ